MPASEVRATPKHHFLVVGEMQSPQFQQCQYLVNKLFSHYPDKHDRPEIRAMLNVDWSEHLIKIRRRYGGDLWGLKVPAAVFVDGRYLGDNTTLLKHIQKTYCITLDEDFERMGEVQLAEHFRKVADLGRDFVTLSITKDEHKLGELLVMLYTDLAPDTCRFFLERCLKGMWNGSRVVRVVKRSWIQFRDTTNQRIVMACENYTVPHDRRGVLSMCNFRRHMLNSTDFHISLDPTPWMDCKYVGFGQVVEGADLLSTLEDTPATHEVPTDILQISETRQFNVDPPPPVPDPQLLSDTTEPAVEEVVSPKKPAANIVEEAASVLDEGKFQKGLYCKASDLKSHLPFLHLPDRLMAYLKTHEEPEEEEEVKSESLRSYSVSSLSSIDCFVNKSKGFLVHSIIDIKALADASSDHNQNPSQSHVNTRAPSDSYLRNAAPSNSYVNVEAPSDMYVHNEEPHDSYFDNPALKSKSVSYFVDDEPPVEKPKSTPVVTNHSRDFDHVKTKIPFYKKQ